MCMIFRRIRCLFLLTSMGGHFLTLSYLVLVSSSCYKFCLSVLLNGGFMHFFGALTATWSDSILVQEAKQSTTFDTAVVQSIIAVRWTARSCLVPHAVRSSHETQATTVRKLFWSSRRTVLHTLVEAPMFNGHGFSTVLLYSVRVKRPSRRKPDHCCLRKKL